MAFDPIEQAKIQAGQPVTQDLFGKTRTNFNDHETRILTLEGAIGAFLPIEMNHFGAYSLLSDKVGLVFYNRITFGLTVNAGRVVAHTAGVSGDLEIDILFKRGVAAFVSIFSTLPKVNFSVGDLGIGTGVLDPGEVSLLAGDILRLDLVSSQADGLGLTGIVEFSKT